MLLTLLSDPTPTTASTDAAVKLNNPGCGCCCPCWRDTDKSAWDVVAGTWLSTNRTNASNSTLRSGRESGYRLVQMRVYASQNSQVLRFGFCSADGDEIYGELVRTSLYAGTVEIFQREHDGTRESLGGPYAVVLSSGAWTVRQLYDDTYCRYSLWNGISSVWKVDIGIGGTPCIKLPFAFVGVGTLPSGYADFGPTDYADRNCICRLCPAGLTSNPDEINTGPTEFDVFVDGLTTGDDWIDTRINVDETALYYWDLGYANCDWRKVRSGGTHPDYGVFQSWAFSKRVTVDYDPATGETTLALEIVVQETSSAQSWQINFAKVYAGRIDAREIDETFTELDITFQSRITVDEGAYYTPLDVRVVASP